MLTGDAAYIKKLNRGLILSKIIEHDGISRADLAKVTGLNKATISVQVADLLHEKLLVEKQQEHNNIGRRPIILSLNRTAGYALGIDLDKSQVIFTLTDLLGYPVKIDTIKLQTTDYEQILSLLASYITDMKTTYQDSAFGLIGVTVGIHGIVSNDEEIDFIPQLQWHNKTLKIDLQIKTDTPVYIENNANLTAIAEKVYKHNKSNYLLSITMHSGIGVGMMGKGELHKGFHGYAGEIGHMIIVPNGESCTCGNRGCLELYASESNFYNNVRRKYGWNELNLNDIYTLIKEQDARFVKEMESFIQYFSIGMNNVINLYNPEVVVLNSELLKIYPNSIEKIKSHLTSTISHFNELLISELGNQACVMGACALAIKNFLEISNLSFQFRRDEIENINM